MNKAEISRAIKSKSAELGFISCGISKAEFLNTEARHLENWLRQGYQGTMSWMERNFDKRVNPALLVDDAKSVVSVLLNYYPKRDLFQHKALKISKYAYGQDYHSVIKARLNHLLEYIRSVAGNVNARCFVDSAPVLDKAWAERSGLGWIGKNGNLISVKTGSFFFIGEIICDLDLEYDAPATDHCGSCTKCIDACPTQAIIKPQLVDGSKCISYLTIELKDQIIPQSLGNKMDGWVFGCDICQDVCPWNRFSTPTELGEFDPPAELSSIELKELTEQAYEGLFKNSAVKRPGYSGLMRNILTATKKEA